MPLNRPVCAGPCLPACRDFGNEAVDVVEQVAQVEGPKAIILGNHDAW